MGRRDSAGNRRSAPRAAADSTPQRVRGVRGVCAIRRAGVVADAPPGGAAHTPATRCEETLGREGGGRLSAGFVGNGASHSAMHGVAGGARPCAGACCAGPAARQPESWSESELAGRGRPSQRLAPSDSQSAQRKDCEHFRPCLFGPVLTKIRVIVMGTRRRRTGTARPCCRFREWLRWAPPSRSGPGLAGNRRASGLACAAVRL